VKKIYGAQSLAGKILISKSLSAENPGRSSQNGTIRFLRAVIASTMIADLEFQRQGWMSHLALVEKIGPRNRCPARTVESRIAAI